MGCNSHLAIEYRPFKGASWWTWGMDIAESRDYRMYAAMADVRNGYEITPIVEPRGFPEGSDAGEELATNHADHSFTWLTPDEYFEAMKRARSLVSEPSDEWQVLKEVLEILTKNYGKENVRLLVGFDS